jgi:Integrase core domain
LAPRLAAYLVAHPMALWWAGARSRSRVSELLHKHERVSARPYKICAAGRYRCGTIPVASRCALVATSAGSLLYTRLHGSTGDSYDNARMENFWSTLKIELVYRTTWRTRDEAENAIFTYIDGWYNTRRIQKGLGDLSPAEYEGRLASHPPQPNGYRRTSGTGAG